MKASENLQQELTWECFEPEAMSTFASEWDQLVSRAHYPAFMRARFLQEAIRAFGCAGGRLALGRAGDELAAGAVLVPFGRFQWISYQPSQLPLGACVVAPGNRWENFLPSLFRVLPNWSTSLAITQQDPLLIERPVPSANIDTLDYVATGWLDVSHSYEQFWETRGKNLRQNLRKQRRKLEEQGAILSFDFLHTTNEIDAAFLEFSRLESAGWKAAQGTSIEVDNLQGNFYRSVLREFANRGAAFAIRLGLDGKAIAVDFGIRDDDSMVLLKTTYDETLKQLSPGQLLHEQAFEHIFRRQLTHRIEFYGRLMDWHQRWTDQSRMLYHVNYHRWPVLRRVWHMLKCAHRSIVTPGHSKLGEVRSFRAVESQ